MPGRRSYPTRALLVAAATCRRDPGRARPGTVGRPGGGLRLRTPGEQVLIVGFPHLGLSPENRWLEKLRDERRVIVFFEAPHRIRDTLTGSFRAIFGDSVAAIGRELTKAHEELVVTPISRHLEHLSEPQGEFTVVVSAARSGPDGAHAELPPLDTLVHEFGELTKFSHGARREIVKDLADRYGLKARTCIGCSKQARRIRALLKWCFPLPFFDPSVSLSRPT